MHTLIKICGLTTPNEADYLNTLPVDFAGMVLFFEKSKRNITIDMAVEIIKALSPSIKKVAVVVSPTLEQIAAIQEAGFDYIQIHGQLPEQIWEMTTIPVLKAFNISDLDDFTSYEKMPGIAGFIFDSAEPGSGKTFNWDLLKELPQTQKMVLLAGGLNSTNVVDALKQVNPTGVDVSSAVEYDDKAGKDPQKIIAFVEAIVAYDKN